MPEFPAPIFLTTRPHLGDVSQGQLITSDNFYELFKCILNPKQLDGLRLLVTLVGDIRPQEFRHRIDTPSLRGVNVQKIFGSQRALVTVEDFTEFEQRAAYFDGDPVLATKKGVNPLDRGTQVHHMAELQKILDFPPTPKLGTDGKLVRSLATSAEWSIDLFRQRPLFHLPRTALLHGQLDARPCARTLLRAANGQRDHGHGGGAN